MLILGDVSQVEAYFSPFGDSVNLSARWVHGLHQTYRSDIVLDAPDGIPR
jgi:hypothetical protein